MHAAAQFTNCGVPKFLSVWLCNLVKNLFNDHCHGWISFCCVSLLACAHSVSPALWLTREVADKHHSVSAGSVARGQAARTWQLPNRENGMAVTSGLFMSRLQDFFLPHYYLTSEAAFYESYCESQLTMMNHFWSILTLLYFRKKSWASRY